MAEDEGPISVPYEEPSEEEAARIVAQAEAGERISANQAALQGQLDYAYGQVQAVSLPMAVGGLAHLSGELHGIAGAAEAAKVDCGEGSYYMNAFNSVAYWCNHGAQVANSTSSMDNDTDLNAAHAEVGDAIISAKAAIAH